MLGTRMSNQDEDEVEDELDALEQELTGNKVTSIEISAEAPTMNWLEEGDLISQAEQQKARARARMEKQAAEAAEPMLA